MINIEFIFQGKSIIIQSNSKEKMKEIFKKFAIKSEAEISSLYFIYGGKVINEESTLSEIMGSSLKDIIKILVYQTNGPNNNSEHNKTITRPNFIMCPKCNENIRYNFNNYKINLFDCRNGHKINNILLNEFDNIQKYDTSKIICQQCKNQNKKDSSFNEFYKCISCNLFLCPLCKSMHDKTHNIINMDKNYICSMHNESYSKYCLECKENSCIQCSIHKNHNNIYFGDIMPNINEINQKMSKLRNSIDIFKQNVSDVIIKLNSIIDNFEIYYKINEFILKNFLNKDRNYEILKNINEINNCDIIINTLNDINNEKNIMNKLNKIFNIYNEMNNKEETKNELKFEYNMNANDSKEILCSNLEIVYETLEKIKDKLPNMKDFDFYKFLSSILFYEFQSNDYSKYRELILKKILSKNDLIKNSSHIINLIFEKSGINCRPEEFENNIKYIKDSDSPLFLLLNNTKNDFLEEIIMNIFERKVAKYFELIPTLKEKELEESYQIYYEQNENLKVINKTGIIFDKSFSIFKDNIKILDDISISNKGYSNLLKLYSIVYVKLYLYYLTSFLINNYQEMNNSLQDVIEYINDISNKKFSKVIKIYILKLIFNFKKRNFKEFKNFDFEKRGIYFFKEFEGFGKTKDKFLEYNILPSNIKELKKYEEILDAFKKNSNFNLENKNLSILLDKYGLDLFLIMILNNVITSFDFDKKDIYLNFCNFAKTVFKNKNYSKELQELLFLFFDYKNYNNNIKPKISKETGIIDPQLFEALLYGFRFCYNSLNLNEYEKNDESMLLFPSLLSEKCQNTIENSLIPGNDYKEDNHLIFLDFIRKFFNTHEGSYGCYVCSCGYPYIISPPGFPCNMPYSKDGYYCRDCLCCGEKIGGGPKIINKGAPSHGMVVRNGHYRLFKDKSQKISQMKLFGDPDENIPNMIFDDYLKNVILPISNKIEFGFNKIEKDFFEKKDKTIRKLSNIGYRLLNFIAYSHLFYSFCMGKLERNKLDEYLIKNCSILEIIEIDWNLLKEALKEKNIESIQIFINMIFQDLIKLIKKCKITKDNKEREKFENKVEKLISTYLEKYPKYNEENEKQDITNIKTLVSEIIPPNSEKYLEKEYPMFKYFHYTKYKNEEDMLNKMNNKEFYPIINQFLLNYPDIKKLNYLPAFNEFTNYMVNYYSFKISREEAKNRSLANEEIIKEKGFSTKYKNFIDAWDHIKSRAKKYKCRPQMEVKEGYSKKDKLINFLNDDGELYNGMYLASACQNFIEWQNEFLQPIVDANYFKGISHKYINNISNKVPLQEAKPEQIILIDEKFKKSINHYVDFIDLIYAFSNRKIFCDDGKIDYSNYNTFEYDYDKIEEELANIILPGVCLFEREDQLNFVSYWGEGFRGKNSNIICEFYSKYPQIDLDTKERQEIINYISKMNKVNEGKTRIKLYNFKNFYGSMQIILFYLTKQEIIKEDETICNIIKNTSEQLKISNDCMSFFYNEGKNFTVKQLMNLFFFFEHLCFDDLSAYLQKEYKNPIQKELKIKITEKLLKARYSNDEITVKELAAATRRLISRYLTGQLQPFDIDENQSLDFQLSREDLWEEKIGKLANLVELIDEKINEFKLTVGQAYEFYQIIGEEDRNAFNINIRK